MKTAGDWDCVVAVEHLPALRYSVDFIFSYFGIMGFIVDLLEGTDEAKMSETSLSGPENMHTLV